MTKMDIQSKRVYSPVEKKDGMRVLVDRVWPRGMAKERITLLFSARDDQCNQAIALKEYLMLKEIRGDCR